MKIQTFCFVPMASGDEGETRLSLAAGEIWTFALVADDAATEELSFTTLHLPRFARLEGALLTLSPGLRDDGTYSFSVSVVSGEAKATALFELTVLPRDSAQRPSGLGQPRRTRARRTRGESRGLAPTITRHALEPRFESNAGFADARSAWPAGRSAGLEDESSRVERSLSKVRSAVIRRAPEAALALRIRRRSADG
jgi:hypothetical protein